MSNIQGINGSTHLGVIKPPSATAKKDVPPTYAPQSSTDEVEISQTAQLLSKVAALPDIREAKVQDIRTALVENTYDVDAKLPQALDNLLDDYA